MKLDITCPYCGHKHDRTENPFNREDEPKPGDISLCAVCTGVLVFTSDMKPIVASENLMRMLQEQRPDVWHKLNLLQEAIRRTRAARGN